MTDVKMPHTVIGVRHLLYRRGIRAGHGEGGKIIPAGASR